MRRDVMNKKCILREWRADRHKTRNFKALLMEADMFLVCHISLPSGNQFLPPIPQNLGQTNLSILCLNGPSPGPSITVLLDNWKKDWLKDGYENQHRTVKVFPSNFLLKHSSFGMRFKNI
jgi:hypothetical protein